MIIMRNIWLMLGLGMVACYPPALIDAIDIVTGLNRTTEMLDQGQARSAEKEARLALK